MTLKIICGHTHNLSFSLTDIAAILPHVTEAITPVYQEPPESGAPHKQRYCKNACISPPLVGATANLPSQPHCSAATLLANTGLAGTALAGLLSHVPLQGQLPDLPTQNISLRSPKLGQSPFTLLCNTAHFFAAVQICAKFTDFGETLAVTTLVAKCRWPQKVLGVRRKPDVRGLQEMPFAATLWAKSVVAKHPRC